MHINITYTIHIGIANASRKLHTTIVHNFVTADYRCCTLMVCHTIPVCVHSVHCTRLHTLCAFTNSHTSTECRQLQYKCRAKWTRMDRECRMIAQKVMRATCAHHSRHENNTKQHRAEPLMMTTVRRRK